MIRMDREDFEALVQEALEDLPDEFAEQLDNVAVVVEEEPDPVALREMGFDPHELDEELFGLYTGTPLIDREAAYSGLPDRVEIYMGPILRACRSRREVVREVKDTVIHELGHHFGLEDEEMPY
ncbi:MAG: metallopeptidase family protein [Gemmatimonadota bacterium]|nr:MAG: metallopeptidase family protein [Gemmatimonadota bacterium]